MNTYELMNELDRQLARLDNANCSVVFYAQVLLLRQAIKAIRIYF